MTNCGFVFVSTLTGRASCTRKRPRATALWRAQLWTGWLWSPSAAPWPPGPTGRNKAAARCTQSPSGGWTLPSPPPQSYPDGHFSFLCARKKVKKAFLPLYVMSGAPSAAEVSAPNPLCPESERASERKAGRRSQVGKCVTLIELCKALSSRGAVYRFRPVLQSQAAASPRHFTPHASTGRGWPGARTVTHDWRSDFKKKEKKKAPQVAGGGRCVIPFRPGFDISRLSCQVEGKKKEKWGWLTGLQIPETLYLYVQPANLQNNRIIW